MSKDHRKRIEVMNRLEYFNDMSEVASFIKKLKDKDPGNEDILRIIDALANINVYVSGLQMDQDSFEKVLKVVHDDRARAVFQLRELRKKVTDDNTFK